MKQDLQVTPQEFHTRGYLLSHNFLTPEECDHFLNLIGIYRQQHEVPQIYRYERGRPLHYSVIDGNQIKQHLSEIWTLYHDVNTIANTVFGQKLMPLENERVGVNVNITPVGGSYRWHYDRNALTGIIYLNEVPGGETELYPRYRLLLGKRRYSSLQSWLDKLLQTDIIRKLFGRLVVVCPERAALVLMQGNRCLHSVRPVGGNQDRINIILAYDEPGKQFAIAPKLDSYLYQQEGQTQQDPNYT